MVQTSTLGGVTSDWLASEATDGNHRYSRENATVAASQTLVDGAVVSTNGSGQIQEYAGATDEVATGIYVGNTVTTGAGVTAKGVVVVRHARIVAEKLTWKTGLSGGKKTEALASLLALGITTARSA